MANGMIAQGKIKTHVKKDNNNFITFRENVIKVNNLNNKINLAENKGSREITCSHQ